MRQLQRIMTVVIARLDRATQYAVACRFITNCSGILDRPVKPGDDRSGRRGVSNHEGSSLRFHDQNFGNAGPALFQDAAQFGDGLN
jgi:hypothetical protein